MIQAKFERLKRKYVSEGIRFNSSVEANICLNCPYPKCKQGWKGCDYYKAEMKKIKGER